LVAPDAVLVPAAVAPVLGVAPPTAAPEEADVPFAAPAAAAPAPPVAAAAPASVAAFRSLVAVELWPCDCDC